MSDPIGSDARFVITSVVLTILQGVCALLIPSVLMLGLVIVVVLRDQF